ncbi:hypothetical protein ACTXT7_005179 [Hymenolepis weldensis]
MANRAGWSGPCSSAKSGIMDLMPIDLLDECGSASSPCCKAQRPHVESPIGDMEARSPDHEMLHEVAPFLEAPQRPAFVRLRSASAPTEAKDCEDAPRQLQLIMAP